MKVHVCADGGLLCSQCVHNERERIDDVDPQCPDDDQWRIIGQQESTGTELCDHCGQTILRDAKVRVTLCSDCDAIVINGMACHEYGCPSSHIDLATGRLYERECAWCGQRFIPELDQEWGLEYCDLNCAEAYNT